MSILDRVSSSQNEDPDAIVWSVRVVGVLFALAENPDKYSKEDIVEYMTLLLERAPTAVVGAAASALMSINPNWTN